MNSDWFDHLFHVGDKFLDETGDMLLLHKVGSSALQLTHIDSGDIYLQFVTTDGETLCINRDVSSDSYSRQQIISLSPTLESYNQQNNKEVLLEENLKQKHEKELDNMADEIRLFIRDFSGTLMFNIRDAVVDGEPVDQSEIVKDFSSLISPLMNTFVDAYNNIRDRKRFFQLVLSGFEYLQNHIYEIFGNPEHLNPDITARFFFSDGGDVELIVSDEKEDVLRYEGHLQQNDTVLTTRAMKYIVIPNIKDVVNIQG